MVRISTIVILLGCTLIVACAKQHDTREMAVQEWYLWTDDGVRHYVAEIGHGPTVVVLHGGWGAEHSYLLDLVKPLGDRIEFVLYDQRGSLRSPAPADTLSLNRLVADLEELRREVGGEKLALLTHSMGSQLAYAYLKQHPNRVRALVMLSAVLPEDADTDDELAARAQQDFVHFAQENEARQVELEKLGGKAWERLTDKEKSARNQISFASGNIVHIARWRQVRGGQAFYDGQVHSRLLENTPPGDWAGLFGALRDNAPFVHLIMGDHDLVDFGLVAWPRLASTLPNASLTRIEQAGHNAWIDQPADVEAALARALAGAFADPSH